MTESGNMVHFREKGSNEVRDKRRGRVYNPCALLFSLPFSCIIFPVGNIAGKKSYHLHLILFQIINAGRNYID